MLTGKLASDSPQSLLMNHSILEPAREIPVVHETDVLVCGGGPAGIAAALAAAESGARTTLLEVNGCLGGVWTAGLLSYVLDPKPESPVTRLLVGELDRRGAKNRHIPNDAIRAKFAWANHSFIYDPEIMKLVLEQECLARGVTIQYHTRVCHAIRGADGRKIEAVLTESKSGRQAWKAGVFIDTTGDGDLAAHAGCGFDIGRPESGEVQPLSLLFLLATPHGDRVDPFTWGHGSLYREVVKHDIHPSYKAAVLFNIRSGLYACMMNHVYADARDAAGITAATIGARKEIHDMMSKLQAVGGAWEGARVVATAEQIGIREGRRIHGRYLVTGDDLREGRVQPDAICKVSFPVDVHSTNRKAGEAFDADNQIVSKPYDVPLRSLIAADLDNLLMAGRNISGDFLAHASYRVTGNSVAMGEAAGCLAARAVELGQAPAGVNWLDYLQAYDRLNRSAPPVREGSLAEVEG